MRNRFLCILTISALNFFMTSTSMEANVACTQSPQAGSVKCACYMCGPDPIDEGIYYMPKGNGTDKEACTACGNDNGFSCSTVDEIPCGFMNKK